MAVFVDNPDTIRDRIRTSMQAMQDENGNALFPNLDSPGSVGYTLRELWVEIMSSHITDLNSQVEAMSPATAVGVDLDQWGQFFGMSRTNASRATGTVEVTSQVNGEDMARITGNRTLAAGTLVQGGGPLMEVAQAVDIPTDGVKATAEVQTVSTGNVTVDEGTEVLFSGYPMLSGVLTTPVSGGTTSEPDDAFRFRLSRAMRAPSSFEGLEAKLLGHPDVSEVDIRSAEYGPGTAEVFVTPAVDYPSENLRATLEARASEGPSRVYIVFPTYEGVSLRIRVSDPSARRPKADVVDFVNNLDPGQTLRIGDIEQVVREAGLREAQVIGARRGIVGEGRTLTSPITLQQITNLPPLDPDYRWYTEEDWIQLCS